MVLDTYKSIPHLLEQANLLLPTAYQVVITTPTATDLVKTVSATVTGAKVGDFVEAAPTAALPANQTFVSASVTAADTVTYVFVAVGAATGAARTFNTYIRHRS